MRYNFIHIDVFYIINIDVFNLIYPSSQILFLLLLSHQMFEPTYIKILDWNRAKDKMWNGIGWYGFIGVITTSTTDISLDILM